MTVPLITSDLFFKFLNSKELLSKVKKFILGIETSCDDTSMAILEGGDEKGFSLSIKPKILAHLSFNQDAILRKWGGVVPEIAARNHMEKITPLIEQVFAMAKIHPRDLDLIGVTTLPGLLGPLLTGLNAAKTLSLVYHTPLLRVNHLFAHLEAIHLTHELPYPYLGLLVSGGHGAFFLVRSSDDFQIIGTTVDDAPGEAFDKGGKLMGLPYPAGRLIDQLAEKGNPQRFPFPIGLKDSANANLSFSGVKTSLRLFLQKHPHLLLFEKDPSLSHTQEFHDLCASYQEAIVNALALKLRSALKTVETILGKKDIPIVVGGGVACNRRLRQKFSELSYIAKEELFFVAPEFCTDNGAMIANYAYRNASQSVPFPECLNLDAQGKFISSVSVTTS